MTITKLQADAKKYASDRLINVSEAKRLVTVAKSSGSKKPIDDVFEAIRVHTDAAVSTPATRAIISSLEQRLTRAEYVAYAQKAASGAGAWAPSSGTKVPKSAQPAAIQKIVERWEQSGDPVNVSSISIAGKPVYMFDQFTDFGAAVGLFDEAGKNIEMKQDTENVKRNSERIQAKYITPFSVPELKNWKAAISKTDIGVLLDFGSRGSRSDPETSRAMSAEMKDAMAQMKASLGANNRLELFHNRYDRTYLLTGGQVGGAGNNEYALFTNAGTPIKAFKISGE